MRTWGYGERRTSLGAALLQPIFFVLLPKMCNPFHWDGVL
jgi:hypothetical protein